MRFFPVLLVIIATALAWQSTVLAGMATDRSAYCADDSSAGGKKDKQKGSGSDEPECE
ncbi:MAG: hypothetical protein KDI22_07170 [Gammaproteobacteria bacterium]|nr:hypothetical protein [Gammaproteobacteria bacterium]MCP5316970.1 hypothetical protein [Chromatiaceae bacterium]MCW5584676.1 hypothetical protein [Chromatiales bacterium]MCB1817463.1 hypothetical protein [Gammaproteobacteria bacterium]MCP5428771.1 hypothetical protein [Chromatiaceae bacterium]